MSTVNDPARTRVPVKIRAQSNEGYIIADTRTGDIWLERWVKDKRFGRDAGRWERQHLSLKATRIALGNCFEVHHEADPGRCGWVNPILVGIPETVEYSDGTIETPDVEYQRILWQRHSR